ncbi:MAG: hypothetical protein MJZ69_06195 [Bacteroidaceae bacterium]|nr:hypothetical protein [Bacteroidaceae bacterium]MDO4955780.1 hypothetical protein [Bacteroidales bacterium]
MKKMILTLLVVMTTSVNVFALSASRSRQEALFLTDKMGYELHLTAMQMDDVYEINYDYFRCLDKVGHSYTSEYNRWYNHLSYVLTPWQWHTFLALDYFLNPVRVINNRFSFVIYNRYYDHNRYYCSRPTNYKAYRGGNMNNITYYRGRTDMHREAVRATRRNNGYVQPVNRVGNERMNNRNNNNNNNNKPVNNGNVNRNENNRQNTPSVNRSENRRQNTTTTTTTTTTTRETTTRTNRTNNENGTRVTRTGRR